MKDTIHWSTYWANGNITSLPEDFKHNYDGEIASYWSSVFSSIPSSSNVLDICSGNGAVALLAAEYSLAKKKSFNISATDAAEINVDVIRNKYPDFELLEPSISFLSECKTEDLNLQSESFDLITSQYGFEYCDLDKATKTIYRLLKANGIFAFITHATDSEMLRVMMQEEKEYKVLAKCGFFQLFEAITDDVNYAFYLRKKIRKCVLHLNAAEVISSDGIIASVVNSIGSVLDIPLDTLEKNLDDMENYVMEMLLGYKRLRDFLEVNIKLKDPNELVKCLESYGFTLNKTEKIIYHKKHNAGRYYAFEKTR